MSLIITVCGNAANEQCPVWPGALLIAHHWGVEGPAKVAGPPLVIRAAFEEIYALLDGFAQRFFAADSTASRTIPTREVAPG